jgi:FG-GAP repeat
MIKTKTLILSLGLVLAGGLMGLTVRPASAATFNQEAKVVGSDSTISDSFGQSVSVSNDGTRMVVGAYVDDSSTGSAYVYVRSGSSWIEEQKLTASNATAGDQFGSIVSMSSDGSRIVVGAYAAMNNRGAAYVYVRSGTTWTEEQELIATDGVSGDRFAYSAAISPDGTRIILGAYTASNTAGAAYVFARSGSSWNQEQKLVGSDIATGDREGISVGISGDGSRAIVGAYGDDNFKGSTYVYSRSGSTWTQEQKLTASDGVSGDTFGVGVAMSSDGLRTIVGADADNSYQGAAYVYRRSGSTWTQEQKLTASDGQGNTDVGGDYFGHSVAISDTGNRAIVSAYGDDTYSGSTYVFRRTTTTWTQENKQVASDATPVTFFGTSVDLTNDGSRIVVGASQMNSIGATYVFATAAAPAIVAVGSSPDPVFLDMTGQTSAVYSLTLAAQPTSKVEITMTSDSNGVKVKKTLTFNKNSWDKEKKVKIKVRRNAQNHGTVPSQVTISHTVASQDSTYNNISVGDVIIQLAPDQELDGAFDVTE